MIIYLTISALENESKKTTAVTIKERLSKMLQSTIKLDKMIKIQKSTIFMNKSSKILEPALSRQYLRLDMIN
jgi:predicted glycosyltransferase